MVQCDTILDIFSASKRKKTKRKDVSMSNRSMVRSLKAKSRREDAICSDENDNFNPQSGCWNFAEGCWSESKLQKHGNPKISQA